jgi:hypothetical protein
VARNRLAQELAGSLERRLAFEERIAQVKREAEQEYGVPCDVAWFNDPNPGPDTILHVTVGRIVKQRQQPLVEGK